MAELPSVTLSQPLRAVKEIKEQAGCSESSKSTGLSPIHFRSAQSLSPQGGWDSDSSTESCPEPSTGWTYTPERAQTPFRVALGRGATDWNRTSYRRLTKALQCHYCFSGKGPMTIVGGEFYRHGPYTKICLWTLLTCVSGAPRLSWPWGGCTLPRLSHFWLLNPILGARFLPCDLLLAVGVGRTEGSFWVITGSPNHMILDTRQVLDPTTADEHT